MDDHLSDCFHYSLYLPSLITSVWYMHGLLKVYPTLKVNHVCARSNKQHMWCSSNGYYLYFRGKSVESILQVVCWDGLNNVLHDCIMSQSGSSMPLRCHTIFRGAISVNSWCVFLKTKIKIWLLITFMTFMTILFHQLWTFWHV